tara:strand:+ start:922 stop:1179 length:258 start_codon:yes stop_codon:yes gene_type:complete
MIVENVKDLKEKLNESSSVLVSVSFYDAETHQIHTSAFTNKFPIIDLNVCTDEMVKVVNEIHVAEVKRTQTPNEVQEDFTKESIS